MSRMSLRALLSLLVLCAAVVAAGCGQAPHGEKSQGIEVAADDPLREGANIFQERCGGCHTLDAAGTEGSATQVNGREYKDGPNFNVRKEEYQDVLYAIQNGGFSSGPMPQNIVSGRQAQIVACFLSKYSGKEAARLPTPGKEPVEGGGKDDCQKQFTR